MPLLVVTIRFEVRMHERQSLRNLSFLSSSRTTLEYEICSLTAIQSLDFARLSATFTFGGGVTTHIILSAACRGAAFWRSKLL